MLISKKFCNFKKCLQMTRFKWLKPAFGCLGLFFPPEEVSLRRDCVVPQVMIGPSQCGIFVWILKLISMSQVYIARVLNVWFRITDYCPSYLIFRRKHKSKTNIYYEVCWGGKAADGSPASTLSWPPLPYVAWSQATSSIASSPSRWNTSPKLGTVKPSLTATCLNLPFFFSLRFMHPLPK